MADSEKKLLIVDDDPSIQQQLRWAFDDIDVNLAGSRAEAIESFSKSPTPVVLLDLGLPPDRDGPSEGLATLEAIMAQSRDTKVVVMTGQTQHEYAVRAIALGAYDFYEKPIEIEILNLIVRRALSLHQLEEENRRLKEADGLEPLPGVIAQSSQMLEICAQVRRFAETSMSVLVLGESGTGKELIANAVHSLSVRAEGPFVALNCAAIPEPLLESELFGHEKGAFTGAVSQTIGKVEQANGGTLFLDEIGDMPIALQAKLLRFLEERSIERVGGRRQIPIDTRLVSATNKDLAAAIEESSFRGDLYYRLAELVVDIPPLRDRTDDVIVIARHVLDEQVRESGLSKREFSSGALGAILAQPWPGNVRQLQNMIRRAVVNTQNSIIQESDLGLEPVSELDLSFATLKACREQAERLAVARAMEQANGNVSKAARILDVSRPTVYQLLRQYELNEE